MGASQVEMRQRETGRSPSPYSHLTEAVPEVLFMELWYEDYSFGFERPFLSLKSLIY